jgi:tellurite resistance protein/DNA-binding MarR family transcriptional regulator
MSEGMVSTLTVEQRVLLHLWDTPMGDNQWEGRPELTQSGVSDAVGIARKHLPRTLKKLREKNYLIEETRHVQGAKQRCRVYGLTTPGRDAARPLVEQLHEREVTIEGDSRTVATLHNHENSMLEILGRIDEQGRYDEAGAEPLVAEDAVVDSSDIPLENRLGIYESIARTAWLDGVVTVDEQAMLDDMALYLGLEPDEVEGLDKKVREEAAASLASGGESLYRTMLEVAWQDGEVDDNEQAMLDSLAGMLGLDSSRDVQMDWVCDQMDDRLKAYCAAMEAAWEDGQISTDEDNMLQSLRESLQITTTEHRTITGAVRAKLN